MNKTIDKINAKPFLKWAGGKRWLTTKIQEVVNIGPYNKYHEPFVGGGSIFFKLNPESSVLSDSNECLIETYLALQQNVEAVISYLKTFKNSKDNYYKIRSQKFRSSEKRAAQFIYLNQLSFNGIYRVNLKGEFNVPYGNRKNFEFDFENLLAVSQALQNSQIEVSDFENSISKIETDDLIFLDPPYTITHNQNGFVKYNQKIFSIEDQYRLSDLIDEVKRKGAKYILTNAAHPVVKEIFDKSDRIIELERLSVVGGKKAKRGMYSEFIFTNIKG